jgi:integrase
MPKAEAETSHKRRYGTGSVFLRGKTYWLQFRVRGRAVRESAHTDVRRAAEKLLRERLTAADTGKITPDSGKVLLKDLLKLLTEDYEANGRKSSRNLKVIYKHLNAHWDAQTKARDVTAPAIETYKAIRLKEGAAAASVNRELAALRRAFRLAIRHGLLASRPDFSLFRESQARAGFFEQPELGRLLFNLPSWLGAVARFMYVTGWRRGEVLSLRWTDVDREERVIRIPTSKSGEPRTLPYGLMPDLVGVIEGRYEARSGSYVFHKGGHKIYSYAEAWDAACAAAGLGGRIPHDFRRTAVRNLERAGVPRSVAMKITGHKTESVYRRYAIVSEKDIAEGLAKLKS